MGKSFYNATSAGVFVGSILNKLLLENTFMTKMQMGICKTGFMSRWRFTAPRKEKTP